MKKDFKIVIAEDELLFARVMRMEFEKQGFQVHTVVDEAAAFEKVMETKPDAILLDIRLKNNSSGIEAARKIRAAGISTLIVFTTGNSYENTSKQISDISNTKILIKPIEFNQLLYLLNEI